MKKVKNLCTDNTSKTIIKKYWNCLKEFQEMVYNEERLGDTHKKFKIEFDKIDDYKNQIKFCENYLIQYRINKSFFIRIAESIEYKSGIKANGTPIFFDEILERVIIRLKESKRVYRFNSKVSRLGKKILNK